MAKAKEKTAAPPTRYASAMDKLRDEMARGKDRYTQVVGEYLTEYLQAHPEAEAAFMDAGKSIAGSLDAVKAEARKTAVNNVGVLDDQTAFGIVLKYFGVKGQKKDGAVSAPGPSERLPAAGMAFGVAQTPAEAPDLFDLDALIEGGGAL